MDDDLIERLQARCVYGDARLLMSSRHDPLSAEAAAEIYRLRAEIKRLKREVDVAASAMVRNHNRAEKAEAERDEARAMLADAERDMRQRAADACSGVEVARWDKWKDGANMLDQGASDGAGECVNAILSLPLKHADREGGV